MTTSPACDRWIPTHEFVWMPDGGTSTPPRWLVQVRTTGMAGFGDLVAVTERDWQKGRSPDWKRPAASSVWLWRGSAELDSRGGRLQVRRLSTEDISAYIRARALRAGA